MSNISPYVARRIAHHPPSAIASMSAAPLSMGDGIGLADCWRIIRRYLRLICGLLAIALLVTGVAVFLMTPDYTASSTLLIEPEPAQVLDIRELISEDGSTEDH